MRVIFDKIFRKETAVCALIILFVLSLTAALFFCAAYRPLRIILTLLTVICVLYIVSEDTSPVFRLGLVVPMLIFPLHGGVFFLLFVKGIARKQLEKRIKMHFLRNGKAADNGTVKRCRAEEILRANGFAACGAKNVTYYPFGDIMFAAMLESIRKAEKSVFLEFFIVSEGKALDMLIGELSECAARGVDVRVIIDGAGSAFTKPRGMIRDMRGKGIKIREYEPISLFSVSAVSVRDHRKILTVDGKYGFCGGINIADEYMNWKVRFGIWKDGGIGIEGSGAAAFESMFLDMWELCGRDAVPAERADVQDAADGENTVIPFADVPLAGIRSSLSLYLTLIYGAERFIRITTPYLVCDDEIIGALCTAAKGGVTVSIVVPGIPDKKYVNIITKSNYKTLINSGVHIYEYVNGFVHSKMLVADDSIAVVGSVNLDYRSFAEHFECGCVLFGRDAVSDVSDDISSLIAESREITAEEAEHASLFVKIARIFLKLIAPLM